jgi:hypothetical protein
MSKLGHCRHNFTPTGCLQQIADIHDRWINTGFVPTGDLCTTAKQSQNSRSSKIDGTSPGEAADQSADRGADMSVTPMSESSSMV